MKKIILFSVFILSVNGLFANTRFQLSNISMKDGLSNLNPSAITQDQSGYIWVATMRGLNRFNGNEFKQYYYNPNDTNSLNSNHLNAILSTGKNLLYIASTNGLNSYNEKLDIFENPFPGLKNRTVISLAEHNGFIYLGTTNSIFRFKSGEEKLERLGKNLSQQLFINNIFFDKAGKLWCCFDNNEGIACYDEADDLFTFYKLSDNLAYPTRNSVKSIFQLSENLLILSTKNGVAYFDLRQNKFVSPSDYSTLSQGLSGIEIQFIMEKEPSIYWIGTYRSGIFIYDKSRNTLERHYLNEVSSEIHSNTYMNYFTDRSGNVWLCTFDAGLDVYFKQAKNFNFDPYLNQMTRNKFITGIAEDQNNQLVVATRENGFYVYNSEKKSYQNFHQQNSQLSYPYIRSIYVDTLNHYWIGHHYGLQLFFPDSKGFKTLPVPEPNNGVVTILQVKNRVFVGTDRQGLLVFDLNGNLLKQIETAGINIPKVIRLNDQHILFSSFENGNFLLDVNTFEAKKIEAEKGEAPLGSAYAITSYCKDGRHLWLGTYNYGLYSYDLITKEFGNFSSQEGLPSSDIVGIEEDDNKNLWLSTSYGLARFNPESRKLLTFFINEGLNNLQFHEKSSFKDRNGVIYFGGNSGLTYFIPAEIDQKEMESPEIILENLYLLNKVVVPGENNRTLKQALPFTREITLTYRDKLFSIDYVGLDYEASGALQYYYILEGFDREWYNVGNQRKVSYSNLSRGTYIFKVKAKTRSDEWSKNQAELIIHVKPAPWFSYLAWAIYFSIIAGIAYFVFRLRIKAFIYKKNLEIEHSEHLREREINVMKQKFFTNISHELRTPLTLIYGLVSQLSRLEKLSPPVKEYIQSLDMNIDRLLKLINQLLTFKKIESETLTLWLEKDNFNETIHKIVTLFSLYAREKEIRIDVLEESTYLFWFDHDKLEKILSNLLSNAIKHSLPGGRIELIVKKITQAQANSLYGPIIDQLGIDYIEISVVDNGAGIEKREWDTIFDRYKQVGSGGKLKPDYSGTGIGLNFTKSLVDLHKGKIRMESEMGKATTFAFILPYDCYVYEKRDFSNSTDTGDYTIKSEQVTVEGEPGSQNKMIFQSDFTKTVLIVEDDPQLNNFLFNSLKDIYKVLTAHEGETGLKIVKQQLPDIVISDIMMPKMDGYELTKSIKGNRDICHIPVILLTAKVETGDQIEGLQSGADLYIPKPFNLDYLLAAIDSQLKNRKRIQEMFFNGMMSNLSKLEINQMDLNFLSKLNSILEKELSNTNLEISLIARNLGMSRSGFYRKFIGLTSLSPIAYIRRFRINKSIELMAVGKYSLIEISEMCGFNSQSYFSTAFRQEQNISPSQYIMRMQVKTESPPKEK